MPFQNLYNNIFDTNEPGERQGEMLERQVKRYPYFTVAHFFLLKHIGPGHPGYAGVAARTAMHFNHPFFLHAQLHKVADAQVTTDNEFATVFHTPDRFPDEMLTVPDDTVEDAVYPEEKINEADYEGTAPAVAVAESQQEVVQSPGTDPASMAKTEANVVPGAEQNEIEHAQQDTVVSDPSSDEEGITITETEEPTVLAQSTHLEPVATVELEPVPEEVSQAPEHKDEKDAPLFEPLFATDYFASQGIKLRDEVLPNDKLGKQLRSFTDWLKTMKKVHEGKLPAGSETLDLSVQKLAEKSNKEEDVITETMAEVYLQQGKQQKAREIYEKLSLLNPSKMAYFAAKIGQIQ